MASARPRVIAPRHERSRRAPDPLRRQPAGDRRGHLPVPHPAARQALPLVSHGRRPSRPLPASHGPHRRQDVDERHRGPRRCNWRLRVWVTPRRRLCVTEWGLRAWRASFDLRAVYETTEDFYDHTNFGLFDETLAASGCHHHSSRDARRAPSASDASLAQAMSGSTRATPTNVPKPQSLPAMMFSRPTRFAKRTIRCAISSECSM